MATMKLFAIGIDEMRDMFRASPELAARLREASAPVLAGRRTPAGRRPHRREAPSAALRSGEPTAQDVEDLLAGRHIGPERLSDAWQLVANWLSSLAWAGARLEAGSEQITAWDFDLAVAGLPSQYGLSRLEGEDLQVPLRPAPDLVAGYVRHAHVLAALPRLSDCLGALPETTRHAIAPLVELLAGFPGWAASARGQGRPAPDLVTLWWRDGTDRT